MPMVKIYGKWKENLAYFVLIHIIIFKDGSTQRTTKGITKNITTTERYVENASGAYKFTKALDLEQLNYPQIILYQLILDKIKASDEMVRKAHFMKLRYQVSVAYEAGFIYAETIDKYQKMLKLHRRYSNESNVYLKLDAYARMETLHKEITHLSNMDHELAGKYMSLLEGVSVAKLKKEFERLKEEKKIREWKKRQSERKKKKNAKFFDRYLKTTTTRRRNTKFPLEYGWDVEQW